MRRIHAVLIVFLFLSVAACTRPLQSHQTNWEAPGGQWQINADGGKVDVSCKTTNLGPSYVELVSLVDKQSPNISSLEALVSHAINANDAPQIIVEKLTSLVHSNLFAGARNPKLLSLIHDPLRLLAVAGQGYSDDFARLLAALCQTAGLEAAMIDMDRHAATAVKWDDVWHVADAYFGIVFRDKSGQAITWRELSVRPDLVAWNLEHADNRKAAMKRIEIYNRNLRFDDISLLKKVVLTARPFKPWPLPAGASVRFDGASTGTLVGQWRMTLDGSFDSPMLKLEQIQAAKNGFTLAEDAQIGSAILRLDLPFPISRIGLIIEAKSRASDAPFEVFVYNEEMGPDDSARIIAGRVQGARSYLAENNFAEVNDKPLLVHLRTESAELVITKIEIEVDFLHAPAAFPHVAGRNASITAAAVAQGPTKLLTVQSWR